METLYQNNILDSLAEGLFSVDKNFKIQYYNRAAEVITGFKKEEVIGQYCKKIFRSDICESLCPIAKVLIDGSDVFDLECKYFCAGSNTIPVKVNATVLRNNNNEPIGGVISFRDLRSFPELDKCWAAKNFHGMIGHSKSMMEIYELISEISDSSASVLIQGETGTGKELIADTIQRLSRRKGQKYVKVNCSVLPEQLMASELFGHIKGAFTDAVNDRIGRFELADRGTIFLDEITEMSPRMQTQILRVIQEGTFERLGESITRKTDVRIIAATNLNMQEAIASGRFREDLYFRLNVIPVKVPPLRKRREDIPYFVSHFLKKFNHLYSKNITDIDPDALDLLMDYDWPGNVREFENAIEYAFIRTKLRNSIGKCSLPSDIKNKIETECRKIKPLFLKEITPHELVELLETNKWNQTLVAKKLNINRTTLWRYLKKNNIFSDN